MKRWIAYVAMLAGAAQAQAQPATPDLAFEGTVTMGGGSIRATVVNRGQAASVGCNVDLRLFDSATHRATGTSRRGAVGPLAPGQREEIAFRYEAEFTGQQVRLTVDSLNRVAELDERNNVSDVVLASPRPGPIRIPKDDGARRPPPVRVGGKVAPTPPPADPAQPQVDLTAEEVTNNGVVLRGTVRNTSALEFDGHRRAILSREVVGSSHVLERADVAERAVPALVPGEEFVIEVPSPKKNKDARRYVFRLRLEPGDDNPDNDVASRTQEQVRID